ncbi:MAG: DNA repair exonuclease [Clostridia bacterium]|nr:DNA repair exonuclease [Lachnospiraceae bacterium]NCC00461.1 DNA repair exonuclease [Clostridia bacterium]NCD02472.1 DNA repair exonuclease [Clostridia bacterium]
MRFIHVADIHLGAVPDRGKAWAGKRSEEIEETFYHLIQEAGKQGVDLILIAGDIFHRPPLKRELKELNYRLESIQPTQVVMMAGNHDYMGEGSNYRGFHWAENVHFFQKEQLDSFYLESLHTWIYGLSYEHREIKTPLYQRVIPLDKPGYHILLAHGGDEKHIPIQKKELISAGFDYVALGHIHKPEIFDNKMAYAGALEPIDRLDIGEHGYVYGEINDKGTRIQFCPAACREYKNLILESDTDMTGGEMEEWLSQQIEIEGKQHIYNVLLKGYRDADIVYDTEKMLRLGKIAAIKDETLPWFDFERLYNENADNLIGMFIKKVYQMPMDEARRTRILSYGLQAMYHGRDVGEG